MIQHINNKENTDVSDELGLKNKITRIMQKKYQRIY
jgi:hypothetical protein